MSIESIPCHGNTDLRLMKALTRICRAGHLHVIDRPYQLCSWARDVLVYRKVY